MSTSPQAVLDLTCALIAQRSNTPDDAGCCEIIAARLRPLGFTIEYLDAEGVTNLWATRGSGRPLTILAGHTDIVPTGPLDQWTSDPFTPEIRDGVLYGRGAADMKSGLAAMVCAVQRLLAAGDFPGTLAFLVTSDEEGMATFGTQHAVRLLQARGLVPDYAIVGEASSNERLGDRIVVGRRGSLGCNLKVIGKQGHVAYPHKGDNPVHRLAPALAELVATRWDEGNAHFPPTSFQISNVHSGTGATNVIPGSAEAVFNFRYSTESKADDLKARVHAVLDRWCPQYEATWWHTGQPFLTRAGKLIDAARSAVAHVVGVAEPELFTGGGTSDARFLAPWGAEVVEIGPINDSIHKINEHVRVDDLEPLSRIYETTLRRLATP
ncbi:succinyldiaminopimelate desuccinylase [Panacagrimonas perspica]|uniref:Succinyl-diaminopimelate desuccinylase n=1 Tax=Panacagrimonas perspica TaxID=381431 RepID=A0A4S3K3F7_9GAMM|nr:succinyl-diaminopimelate desuccinylase [Panacagrimonas perspica]TDU31205.1 succinyldiaminopimelate desuccinylase [Panacagrimonas perspica]THD02562.1 succinyl-diaminopimelate desuccinylase [Panacagrimonas perspica]